MSKQRVKFTGRRKRKPYGHYRSVVKSYRRKDTADHPVGLEIGLILRTAERPNYLNRKYNLDVVLEVPVRIDGRIEYTSCLANAEDIQTALRGIGLIEGANLDDSQI